MLVKKRQIKLTIAAHTARSSIGFDGDARSARL